MEIDLTRLKPLLVSNPVLDTLIFHKILYWAEKKPFKPYPYKLNCVSDLMLIYRI